MEEIVLGVKVNTGDGKRTVADLRNEMQTLTKEVENTQRGTDAYAKAIQRLGETKAELKDLKEDIQALDPDAKAKAFIGLGQTMVAGFTAAQGAAALFGSENEDIQKGILKMQAAIGVLHGIQAAADAADQVARLKIIGLKQLELLETKKGIVATEGATVAQRLWNLALSANPIGLVVTALVTLTAAIGTYILLTNKSTEAQKVNNEALEKGKQNRDQLTASIRQTEIALKEETGQFTKQQAEQARLKEAYYQKLLQLGKDYAIEAGKNDNNNEATQIALRKQYDELKLQAKKEYEDKWKLLDVKTKNSEKEEEKKHQEELLRIKKVSDEKELNKLKDKYKEINDTGKIYRQDSVNDEKLYQTVKTNVSEEGLIQQREAELRAAELRRQDELAEQAARFQIAQDTVAGLSAFVDIAIQDGERAKNIKKGLALADIAIDTAKAISALTAASNQNPLNGVTAGAAGIAQYVSGIARILANVAKAKQLLTGGGVSGSVTAPTSGGGSVQAPRVQTSQDNLTTTRLGQEQNSAQKPMEVRVSVLESEITNTQQRVKVIQDRATF